MGLVIMLFLFDASDKARSSCKESTNKGATLVLDLKLGLSRNFQTAGVGRS